MYCSRCGTQNKDTAKFCDSCGLDLTATTPVGALSEAQEITEIEMVRKELDEEYEIVDELGRGGMAIVFKAKEKQLDREVAIKVLPFSLAFDREFVERFQREARTSARLEHPNIIPIYRVGKSGRVIYFVMKFLRGKPLSNILAARGSLPPAEIRKILADVARALAYAHKKEIVHRDIKPDNIMFDEHGHAVVTDFGIAKAASGGKLTGTGMSIGTPHYMSPEQAKAQPLDGRSDIYSLGVVAYQCLTGSVPYDGEDSFSIGYRHIMEEIPTPPLENPEKRQLFEVVKKMMAKTPAQRFQNAEELVSVLEGGRSVSFTTDATMAMPSLSSARLPSAPTTPLPRATGGRPPGAEPARHGILSGLLLWLLIVGTVFGGGGFYAYKKGLIFAKTPGGGGSDSTAARDTTARAHDSATVAGDATKGGGADSGGTATAPPPPISPGTPGRLVLQNVPPGARISVEGQPARGTQLDLTPGVHPLPVRAGGCHHLSAGRDSARPRLPRWRDVGSACLRHIQRGDVQQRRARDGKAPALESGPEERRADRRVGTVAVPAGAPVIPKPRIDPTAFIAPGAVVLGDVTLAPRSSVWYQAVLRGDMAPIVIGEATNIQDATIVHVCIVEDDCLIGMGSILLNDVRIGTGSVVAAGAVVPEGTQVPPGSLVIGVPARVVRHVDDGLRARIRGTWEHYVGEAERHRSGAFPVQRTSL